MKEVIYEWVRNMVFYQLLVSIILNMIPNNTYQKYIRFFLGMLFIIIAIQPVLKGLQLMEKMDVHYVHEMMEQELNENSLEFHMEDIYGENEETQ